jgi:hypothetical protein
MCDLPTAGRRPILLARRGYTVFRSGDLDLVDMRVNPVNQGGCRLSKLATERCQGISLRGRKRAIEREARKDEARKRV